MGLLLSRFRRKKTTIEVLEALEKRIRSIELKGHSTEQQKRRVIGSLMVFSIGLYVLTSILFYFYLRSTSWKDIILYLTPLLLFPILVILSRAALTRYYEYKLKNNKSQLVKMRAEKKKILEDVMDTEKYKYAKEILDKFGEKNELMPLPVLNTPVKLMPSISATPTQLRNRQVTPVARTSINNNFGQVSNLPRMDSLVPSNQMTPARLPSAKLPRPIVSTGGGAFDRLVDYLVGDGAGSRYALICTQCMGHNGMALPEEFEYLSYRCAYCHFLNLAKKQKPKAPPLLTTPVRVRSSVSETITTVNNITDSDESIDENNEVKDSKDESIIATPLDMTTSSSDAGDSDNHVAQGESTKTTD